MPCPSIATAPACVRGRPTPPEPSSPAPPSRWRPEPGPDGRHRFHGRYVVAALPRELPDLRHWRFATQVRDKVSLVLGQSADIDFALGLSGTQEEITVLGAAPIVDVSQTAVSSVVSQQQIDSLPINGRNFISFSVITPGATTDRTPQQGATTTSGLSFGGQRARSNNIMVDGLDNTDATVGSARATFSQEAIREFQVLTNSYSAEFGKASGGVVNIVTKSGTNDFHGNVFFYFRDESLNAKDHFEKFDVLGNAVDREKAPFGQKQWGATLGGPLKKDKTFFFLSFERVDIQANNFVNIDPAAAQVLRANGFPVELGNVPYDFKATEFLAKVDHQWGPNHSLALRGNFSDTTNENIEPFGGIVARSRGAVQLRKDWSISMSETDILSPKWVNETRFQFARQDQKIDSLDPNCNGPCDDAFKGGPTLEVVGVASVGRQRFTPQPRKNDRFQLTETLSYFGGGHQIKAGIDFPTSTRTSPSPPTSAAATSSLPCPPSPESSAPITSVRALALGLPGVRPGYGSYVALKYQDLSFIRRWHLGRATVKPGLRYKTVLAEVSYDVSDLGGARLQYTFLRTATLRGSPRPTT